MLLLLSATRLGPPLPKKFSGDFVGRVTPVPIPNTEVKPAGADGTARETVWESRKSPGLFKRRPAEQMFGGLSCFCSGISTLLRGFPSSYPNPTNCCFRGATNSLRLPAICGAQDVRVPEFNVATTIPRLCSGLPAGVNFFAITAVWSSKVSIRSADWRELQPTGLQPSGKDPRLTTAASRDTRCICLRPSVWLSGT